MSNTETKLTREQHDVLIASTENMIAQNAAEIRKWRDKSVAANKVLDKALIDWRAAFPVRSAIDVHKANCEADAARKQALKDQGYPANYVRQSAKPQSDLDAMLLNVRAQRRREVWLASPWLVPCAHARRQITVGCVAMADAFDEMFEGGEPEQSDAPKKVGLVVGARMTPEEFAAKFVGKRDVAIDKVEPVTFEVWDDKTQSWVELPADAPTPPGRS